MTLASGIHKIFPELRCAMRKNERALKFFSDDIISGVYIDGKYRNTRPSKQKLRCMLTERCVCRLPAVLKYLRLALSVLLSLSERHLRIKKIPKKPPHPVHCGVKDENTDRSLTFFTETRSFKSARNFIAFLKTLSFKMYSW